MNLTLHRSFLKTVRRVLLLLLLAIGSVAAVGNRHGVLRAPRTARLAAAQIEQPRAVQPKIKAADLDAPRPDEREDREVYIEEPVFEELPQDPVETGFCSLDLMLVDVDSGYPAQGTVQLWRLDAPGNEYWERGDQLQALVDIPPWGVRVNDLPRGRYRIFCLDQRTESTDPPAFELSEPCTTVTQAVPMPDRFRVHLKIYTESGHLVRHALRRERSGSRPRRCPKPTWRKWRQLKGHVPALRCNLWSSHYPLTTRDVVATALGFDLGEYRDDSRREQFRSYNSLKAKGFTYVRLKLCRLSCDRTYIALCVREEPIIASIVVPGGQRASDVGAKFRIYCRAELEPLDAQSGGWRTLPISVTAALKGFKPITFVYHLGDRLPIRCLSRQP